jgi:hypothetical protein
MKAPEHAAMTKDDCRAKALKCYRIAQKTADRDIRRALLDLAVQWRKLAADRAAAMAKRSGAHPAGRSIRAGCERRGTEAPKQR